MAEDNDRSQKTEQPTQGRLDRAREQGQVSSSRELNHWFQIGAGTLVVFAFAPDIASSLTTTLTNFIARPEEVPDNVASLEGVMTDALVNAGLIIFLPMLLLLVAAVAGPLLQTGFLFSADPIKPNFAKLSPLAGFKRLFSMKALVEFLKNLAKLGIIGSVAIMLLRPVLPGAEHYIGLEPVQVMGELRSLILRMCFGVLITLTLIMIIDVIYQRFAFIAKLRMTRQEVKDEMKQSEGDPIIKQRLRQLRMQRARIRMMANVPKADVVVTNPTHFAVALQYNPKDMTAPLCLAKGQDLIALKIREVAKKNKVTIVENPPLARALYATVEIDQEISPEHYKAVAEVISYVFRLRGRNVN